MTTLIFGLDGLDAQYVQEEGLLASQDPKELTQDLDGANGLYTYRVWPSIFAGDAGGASDDEYTKFKPDSAYIWEKYPTTTLLAPVSNPSFSQNTDAFPTEYMEGFNPGNRLDQTLNKLESGLYDAFNDGVPLVVACTRTPDIVGHHMPDEAAHWIRRSTKLAEKFAKKADDSLIVSDHGFKEFGMDGIEAHTRRATFASSFCDYDRMSEFCENWHDDLARVMSDAQLEALGYV